MVVQHLCSPIADANDGGKCSSSNKKNPRLPGRSKQASSVDPDFDSIQNTVDEAVRSVPGIDGPPKGTRGLRILVYHHR